MRDRRHILDRGDGEAGGLQRPERRFAARSRPLDLDLEHLHAMLHRLAGGAVGGDLGGIGRRLPRALEALAAGRGPGHGVALGVGDGDDRIVEAGIHVGDARGDVLAFATARPRRGWLSHDGSLFLAAGLFLLAGDRARRALAGPRIGVRTLAMHRQALAVAQAAIAAEVHQPLDVHRHLAAQVALDLVVAIDDLADADDLVIGELVDPPLRGNAHLGADLLGFGPADAMDVGQADQDPFLRRYVDARNTRHGESP